MTILLKSGARVEQDAINRIANALESLMMALTTYDMESGEVEQLDALADSLEQFAEAIEEKDAAA